MIVENKINILIADQDDKFHSFMEKCVISEDRVKEINIMRRRSYEDIPQHGLIEIFIIGECDNNEKILEAIDRIRSGDFNKNSHIFVATKTMESKFLKNLINKRICGLIDKNDKDCSHVIEAIEKEINIKSITEYVKSKIKKL